MDSGKCFPVMSYGCWWCAGDASDHDRYGNGPCHRWCGRWSACSIRIHCECHWWRREAIQRVVERLTHSDLAINIATQRRNAIMRCQWRRRWVNRMNDCNEMKSEARNFVLYFPIRKLKSRKFHTKSRKTTKFSNAKQQAAQQKTEKKERKNERKNTFGTWFIWHLDLLQCFSSFFISLQFVGNFLWIFVGFFLGSVSFFSLAQIYIACVYLFFSFKSCSSGAVKCNSLYFICLQTLVNGGNNHSLDELLELLALTVKWLPGKYTRHCAYDNLFRWKQQRPATQRVEKSRKRFIFFFLLSSLVLAVDVQAIKKIFIRSVMRSKCAVCAIAVTGNGYF